MTAVKVAFLRERIYPVFRQILVSSFIGYQIDRIGENPLDGEPSKLLAGFRGTAALQEVGFHLRQGTGFQKFLKNPFHN